MFEVMRWRVTMISEHVVQLPPYIGATLRGGLATGLKSSACLSAERGCQEACASPNACAYGLLMETPHAPDAPARVRASRFAPHPHVLCPLSGGGALLPGKPLRFDLTLMGPACEMSPLVVSALSRMAQLGLGMRRGELRLAGIEDRDTGESLYARGRPRLDALSVRRLRLAPEPEDDVLTRLTLRLETPLQLIRQGQLVREPDVGELVYACADRLALLMASFGPPGVTLPDAAASAAAAREGGVRVSDASLHYVSFERWSNRQRARHPIEGLIGTLTLEGRLAPLMPLLRAGTLTHIGKGTSFGLGAITLLP